MLQFILTIVTMLAVGVVLVLVARALPRIDEAEFASHKQTIFERWLASGMPEKVDAFLKNFLGKLFRRLKVVLMRFDNYLTGQLKKMGSADATHPFRPEQTKSKIDLKELPPTEMSSSAGDTALEEPDTRKKDSGAS